jgi:ubiquinone biosynthesis protein
VFVQRFFHADPHPGNFAVLPDGRVVAYDFGMIGQLSARTSRSLLSLLRAVSGEDVDRVIDAAIDLDIVQGQLDRPAFARDIGRLIDRYRSIRIQEINIQLAMRDIRTLIRTHHLRLPADLALLLKTLAMHESSARKLDPSFAPIEVAEPYAHRALVERYRPASWLGRLASSGDDAFELLLEGPQRIDRLLSLIERGNVQTSMRLSDWEKMLAQMQALVNRLVVAWLVGASLISLSVLLAIYRPGWIETWLGPLFWIGAAITVTAGGFLALFVLRRKP